MSLERRSELNSDRRHERRVRRVHKRGGREEFFDTAGRDGDLAHRLRAGRNVGRSGRGRLSGGRGRGGGLFYALWDVGAVSGAGELEGR